jgi:hypothetical protein
MSIEDEFRTIYERCKDYTTPIERMYALWDEYFYEKPILLVRIDHTGRIAPKNELFTI